VEVAYPLRPSPRIPADLSGIARRVVIPEASFWDPSSPFLYLATVELWEDERLCQDKMFWHGLRFFHLGPRGLRMNSRPLMLRGVTHNELRGPTDTWNLLEALHQGGFNLLMVDVASVRPELLLWDKASQVGILVLGRVAASLEAIARATDERLQASNLGWILDPAIFRDAPLRLAATPLLARRAGELIGVDAAAGMDQLPPEAQFVVGTTEALAGLPNNLPRLVLGDADHPESPGLLGTVRR
jgi:hypothetical protein